MIIKTTQKADAVLAIIEALLGNDQRLVVEPYQNGREHGWSLTNMAGLRAAFSESRNSDEVVVYRGRSCDFEMGGNIPSEAIYSRKAFFRYNDISGAAWCVLEYLHEAVTQ